MCILIRISCAEQNEDHKLGPPSIHLGKTILEEISSHEGLREKEGLRPLLESVNNFLQELKDMDMHDCATDIGHCKFVRMYDRQYVKLSFAMPKIMVCNNKTTTLGSIVSRLLRSMGYNRWCGVAPRGHLEREIQRLTQGNNGNK